MKTLLLTLTYIVGAGELILAIYFWITNSKNEIRRVATILSLSTGLWALSNALSSYVVPSSLVDFYLYFDFVTGIIIVTSLLHFTIIFPNRMISFDKLHATLLYVPALIFSIMVFQKGVVINGYSISLNSPGYVNPGPEFTFYQLYVAFIFFTSIIILLGKIPHLDGINKTNASIFLASVFLGGLPAIAINLSFIFFGALINPLIATIFSAFWVGGTSYLLLKK